MVAVTIYKSNEGANESCNGMWQQEQHLVIVPDPLDQRPAIARSSDVFPVPLGPTISSESPLATCPHPNPIVNILLSLSHRPDLWL